MPWFSLYAGWYAGLIKDLPLCACSVALQPSMVCMGMCIVYPGQGKRKTRASRLRGFFLYMAEKVRFELTVLAYTRVPGVHLKPLGHLSVALEKRDELCIPAGSFWQSKSVGGLKKREETAVNGRV